MTSTSDRPSPAGPPAEPSPQPVQHISGPAELVQAVPYLLGFHPTASLVLVGLSAGQLVVTARLDLADEPDRPVESVIEHTVAAMHRGGSRQFVGLVYPQDDPDGHPVNDPVLESRMSAAQPALGRAADHTDADRVAAGVHGAVAGVHGTVLDVLCVVGDRWRSLECTAPDCCPSDGQVLPAGPSAFAAAATVSGVVALPNRAALGRQLDPDPHRTQLGPLIAQAENADHDAVLSGRGRRRVRSTTRTILATARAWDEPHLADGGGARPPSRLDDATAARFGAALGETAVRDAVWTAIDQRRVDGRELWRELARRLPEPYDAPALFLFGWATWRHGDGALAGIAAERAVASDPTYTAADLLLAALAHGIDPRSLPRVRLSRPA